MNSKTNRNSNVIDVGVGAIITNKENKILLLKKNSISTPVWSIPGGCIEYKETPLFALKREVKEETGLKITSCRFLGYINLLFNNQHWISFVFHVTKYSGKIQISNDEPFINAKWHSKNNLPQLDFIAKKTTKKFISKKWVSE